MFIIIGLVIVAGFVAVAEVLKKSKSEYALNSLWTWLIISLAIFVLDLWQGTSVASAAGSFVPVFGLPAIIAVFLWRFFKLT